MKNGVFSSLNIFTDENRKKKLTSFYICFKYDTKI